MCVDLATFKQGVCLLCHSEKADPGSRIWVTTDCGRNQKKSLIAITEVKHVSGVNLQLFYEVECWTVDMKPFHSKQKSECWRICFHTIM